MGRKINMTDLIYVGTVTICVIILYVCLVILERLFRKPKKQKSNPQYYVDNVNSLEVSPEEFYKVVNFLLLYGVIDLEKYNQIIMKGLPYTG